MNRKFKKVSNVFFISILSISVLSSCSPKKAPEDILTKTKQAIVDVTSGKVHMKADLTGESEKTNLKFTGDLSSTFEKDLSTGEPALDLNLGIEGSMKTEGSEFNLKTVVEFISKEAKYYIKIGDFTTNNQDLQFLTPLITPYKGKWLHLAEGFIPDTFFTFKKSETDIAKTKQLNDLFVQTELFSVKKDEGIEKINGRETYHLLLGVNKEAFKDYFNRVALINGTKIADSDLQELLAALDQVSNLEIYVDTERYYIYKANISLYNKAPDEASHLEIRLAFDGSDFNSAIEIKIPETAEEFNPLALPALMGTAATPTTPAETAAP